MLEIETESGARAFAKAFDSSETVDRLPALANEGVKIPPAAQARSR